MATHEVEVEVVRLTKIMKKYEYLEQRVNLHLFMIFILSIVAIILGAGVLIVNDHNDISISSNKKFIDKNSGPDSIPFGSILASISGFFSSSILLFSTYLSTITSKLGKNRDEVYFVVKHFKNNGKSYNVGFFNRKPTPMDEFYVEDNNNKPVEFSMNKIEKQNSKLQSVRIQYRVISIFCSLVLIILTILIFEFIFKERNSLKNGPPENCQKFTDCLDFMKSLNLTIGEFGIVCNVDTNTVRSSLTELQSAESIICQKDIFGCNEPGNMDLLDNYNNNIASPYVKYYFDNCYNKLYYTYYKSDIIAWSIISAGLCGGIHYLCIMCLFFEPSGVWLYLQSVCIPFILLNLAIVGLFPGCRCCCCQDCQNCGELSCYCCCCKKIPGVFRVFLTFDEKFCLNELKRKRNSKTDSNA